MNENSLLVVSAHAADYVWRSGGVIAKYIEMGSRVKVIVLSLGVRGESNDLWKKEGITYQDIYDIRLAETTKAAGILGLIDIEFWNKKDYIMSIDESDRIRLARIIREFRPDSIITQAKNDVLNPDHNNVHQFVFESSIMANSSGVKIENLEHTPQMKLFGFEPHQTELSGYVPEILIDITSVFEKKMQAMQCFEAQKHLIDYYADRGKMRGNHARRLSGNQGIKYAETFERVFPVVSEILV